MWRTPSSSSETTQPVTSWRLIQVAFWTILRKEILRFMRIWVQTLIPAVVTSLLYLIIFGQIMGSYLHTMHNVPYIHYLIPGLVMMTVINNAYANVVSSFFGAKFQHNIEEILVSPTPLWVVLAGYVLAGIIRGMLVGGLVLGVAECFSPLTIAHPGLMLLVWVLTAGLFATAGLINAIFAKKFDDVNIVPTFILTPLIYLGGIFYSVEILPPFWKTVSFINPVFYMINAFRYSFLGFSDTDVIYSLCVIAVCNTILLCAALGLLYRGIGMKN